MCLPQYCTLLIYAFAINFIAVLIIVMEYHEEFFKDNSLDFATKTYDYIIVGSGTAGSIVARRLSQNHKTSVLVLEAGSINPSRSSLLNIPTLGFMLRQTSLDWNFKTEPQKHSCRGLNNFATVWPSGRLAGGTSFFNNMIYVRGHQQDYEEWFNKTLDFNYDIKPYIKKLELETITLSDLPFKTSLSKRFLDAAKHLNLSQNETLNCKGFSEPKITLKNGQRRTSFHKLNLQSPNLVFKANSLVLKVLLDQYFNAYAVKVKFNGQTLTVKSRFGIILCAGTINSAKILLNSGIGPKSHLQFLGILNKIDLPVGMNLQDHLTTGVDLVLTNQSLGLDLKKLLSPWALLEYFFSGKGALTTIGSEGIAFVAKEGLRPHLQLMPVPLSLSHDKGFYLKTLVGISWNKYWEELSQKNSFTIFPILLHPKSRGWVKLSSNNPEEPPRINPNYLQEDYDLETLVEGLTLVESLLKTPGFKNIDAHFFQKKYPGCETYDFASKPYWKCYVKHVTISSYHPVGTCKMGDPTNPSSVVDFNFQVLKTTNLFVVDASVLPGLPSGNPMGPIMVLAELASDRIKFQKFQNLETCKIRDFFG